MLITLSLKFVGLELVMIILVSSVSRTILESSLEILGKSLM